MRLLKYAPNGDFKLVSFNRDPPPYAILSHTWLEDDEEVTYDEMIAGTGKNKCGYAKIRRCGEKAAKRGLDYFWVDTCCLDKRSSAELSESINSMYRWYQRSEVCYAYIEDWPVDLDWADSASIVPDGDEIGFRRLQFGGRPITDSASEEAIVRKSTNEVLPLEERVGDVSASTDEKEDSICNELRDKPLDSRKLPLRWFTRGWTLQELIAPRKMEFFDKEWRSRGMKSDPSVIEHLSRITGISLRVLRDSSGLAVERICHGQRMSWAAFRSTSREEDIAYCLLGIFQVNIPLLYGEGSKAFIRLQEAILASSTDLSLLAWTQPREDLQPYRGILSRNPYEFRGLGRCHLDRGVFSKRDEIILTNKGVRVETSLFAPKGDLRPIKSEARSYLLSLGCYTHDKYVQGIVLTRMKDTHVRAEPTALVRLDSNMGKLRLQRIYLARDDAMAMSLSRARRLTPGLRVIPKAPDAYSLEIIESWPHGYFDVTSSAFGIGDRTSFAGFLHVYILNRASTGSKDKEIPVASFMVVISRDDHPSIVHVNILEEDAAIKLKADIKSFSEMDPRSARSSLADRIANLRRESSSIVMLQDSATRAVLRIGAKVVVLKEALCTETEEIFLSDVVAVTIESCRQHRGTLSHASSKLGISRLQFQRRK